MAIQSLPTTTVHQSHQPLALPTYPPIYTSSQIFSTSDNVEQKHYLIGFSHWVLVKSLSRNKIWYRLYSDIWTKLTVQAPDRKWDEDLLPFKKTSFFPLYVEYVDEIFNPHPHIPHMRIIRIFRIFRIRMANPNCCTFYCTK